MAIGYPAREAGAAEWNRFRAGGMLAYENSGRYSIAPTVSWTPRAPMGETFYLAAETSVSAFKSQFVTSALFGLGFAAGWRDVFGGISPEIGLGAGYMTGGDALDESVIIFVPKAALFWEIPGEPVLWVSALGASWSYAGATLASGQGGFPGFHRFELLAEVRL